MGDAETAQYNAFNSVFWSRMDCKYLMCFFHVMKNVKDRTRSCTSATKSAIFKHIYKMHFSENQTEFEKDMRAAIDEMKGLSDAPGFAGYFKTQWLDSPFRLARKPTPQASFSPATAAGAGVSRWGHSGRENSDITRRQPVACWSSARTNQPPADGGHQGADPHKMCAATAALALIRPA